MTEKIFDGKSASISWNFWLKTYAFMGFMAFLIGTLASFFK